MSLFFNYNVISRVFPSALGLIPFFVFQFYYLNDFLDINIFKIEVISNVSITLILLYLVSQIIIRYPSKLLEKQMYNDGLNFPTTNFLLLANHEFSKEIKKQIHTKISVDFGLKLLTKKEELNSPKEARKIIKDAVKLIISKVGSGKLVLQHNIEYGFARNLWGASCVGLILSTLLLFFTIHTQLIFINILVMVSYTVYIFLGKKVIDTYAVLYARKLIEEYYEK